MKKPSTDNAMFSDATNSKRPSQRVLDYLREKIEEAGADPQRLPTIRSIAKELDVSPRTVQKAFHRMAAENRIESVTGRGTFTVPAREKRSEGRTLRIALNIELDSFDPVNAWAYTIYGSILQAALVSGRNAVFCSVDEGLREEGAPVDGFILLPDAMEIAARLKRVRPGVPAVSLNPLCLTETANFVSPDYNRVGRNLGEAWRNCGKKRIVFMHHPSLANSASGQLVLSGILAGLADAHADLDFLDPLEAENFTTESGFEAMRGFLRRKGRQAPDAVFCKGDFLALGALQALREAGCAAPEDVSVIGGSGLDLSETDWPQLTRCRQPFQQLGEALFAMLVARIDNNGANLPGRYLPAPFIGGATSGPGENELLLAGREAAV